MYCYGRLFCMWCSRLYMKLYKIMHTHLDSPYWIGIMCTQFCCCYYKLMYLWGILWEYSATSVIGATVHVVAVEYKATTTCSNHRGTGYWCLWDLRSRTWLRNLDVYHCWMQKIHINMCKRKLTSYHYLSVTEVLVPPLTLGKREL